MSDFRYLLTVLGNGRTEYLNRTMDAIEEHLSPQPAEVFVFDDSKMRLGQCAAMAKCWEYAAASEYRHCFHFEEDYVCLRPIDVSHMVMLMDWHRHLLQLTLMRQAWLREIEFGGYITKDPSWYERCEGSIAPSPEHMAEWPYSIKHAEWIETTRNWANAPTLFRTSLAREFEWPAEPGCETSIGPQMLAKYPEGRFAILGAGEVWASHIGVERAVGSHGY